MRQVMKTFLTLTLSLSIYKSCISPTSASVSRDEDDQIAGIAGAGSSKPPIMQPSEPPLIVQDISKAPTLLAPLTADSKNLKLKDIVELRNYFKKGLLEITPQTHRNLLQYAAAYKEGFAAYDRGISLTGWSETDELLQLLYHFNTVKSIKCRKNTWQAKIFINMLTDAIQHYEALETLDLKDSVLNGKEVLKLLKVLPNPSNLKSLNIKASILDSDALSEIKKKYPQLEELTVGQAPSHSLSSSSMPQPSQEPAVNAVVYKRDDDTEGKSKALSQESAMKMDVESAGISLTVNSDEQKMSFSSAVFMPSQTPEQKISSPYSPVSVIEEPKENPCIFSETEAHLPSDLIRRAHVGEKEAFFAIAEHYRKGHHVLTDPVLTFQWTLKAAEKDHANAQFNVAIMYAKGLGVPKDDKEAFFWFEKAAQKGDAVAQFNVGVRYEQGLGGSKNLDNAFNWYKKAAEQKHVLAQVNVATLYAKGQGIAKDEKEALKWFQEAATQGHAEAQYRTGVRYEKGLGTSQDLTQAAAWYQKAATQGHMYAQFTLGALNMQGVGVPKDEQKAFGWFEKAATQGYAEAQYNLGVMYYTGKGVSKDRLKATQWLQKAAAQNHSQAKAKLATFASSHKK